MHLSKPFTLAIAVLPMALATPVARYPELEALEHEALEPESFAPALVQCFVFSIPGVDIVNSCKKYRELSIVCVVIEEIRLQFLETALSFSLICMLKSIPKSSQDYYTNGTLAARISSL
jgi:hypothetical protein